MVHLNIIIQHRHQSKKKNNGASTMLNNVFKQLIPIFSILCRTGLCNRRHSIWDGGELPRPGRVLGGLLGGGARQGRVCNGAKTEQERTTCLNPRQDQRRKVSCWKLKHHFIINHSRVFFCFQFLLWGGGGGWTGALVFNFKFSLLILIQTC